METKEQRSARLKQQFRNAVNQPKENTSKTRSKYIIIGLYVGGALAALWASQFVFIALSKAILSFKELRRSIRS